MAPKKQGIVETPDTLDGEITETRSERSMRLFAEYMANRATVDESMTQSQGMSPIMERILTAETEEEIWDADEGSAMPDGTDLVDIEQRIFSFDVMKSKKEDISKPELGNTYLLVHAARLDTGEEILWNTSANLLVTKLMRFERIGKFNDGGYLDTVIRSTDLGGGKSVLKFRPVAQRAL